MKDDRALLILEKNDSDRRLTLEKSEFLDTEFVEDLDLSTDLSNTKFTLFDEVYVDPECLQHSHDMI